MLLKMNCLYVLFVIQIKASDKYKCTLC